MSEGARSVVENGRLGMTADWGFFFLVGKVMEQGGMGETPRVEGRKGLGPNVVLVLILVLILVDTLVLDVVLVLVFFFAACSGSGFGSGTGCKTGAQGVT